MSEELEISDQAVEEVQELLDTQEQIIRMMFIRLQETHKQNLHLIERLQQCLDEVNHQKEPTQQE